MLRLAICEPFEAALHGKTRESAKDIEGRLLVEHVDLDDFYSDDYKEFRLGRGIDDPNYTVRLEIVETDELEGGEAVGTVRTQALVRLQRKWRDN